MLEIKSKATANGEYILEAESKQIETESNYNLISVVLPEIEFNMVASNKYVYEGDTILYTISVKNTLENQINNVEIVDEYITKNTTVSELFINDQQISEPLDIKNGILIEKIDVSQEVIITFKATLNKEAPDIIPNIAHISYTYSVEENIMTLKQSTNPVEISVIKPKINIVKTSDKDVIEKNGETISFTLTINNDGNVQIENILVYDTLQQILRYVPVSTCIDKEEAVDVSPNCGIKLGSLKVGETRTISYKAKVIL